MHGQVVELCSTRASSSLVNSGDREKNCSTERTYNNIYILEWSSVAQHSLSGRIRWERLEREKNPPKTARFSGWKSQPDSFWAPSVWDNYKTDHSFVKDQTVCRCTSSAETSIETMEMTTKQKSQSVFRLSTTGLVCSMSILPTVAFISCIGISVWKACEMFTPAECPVSVYPSCPYM